MNSSAAFRSRQTTVLELAAGEVIRIGEHVLTVAEINGSEVKVFVERIAGDDDGDDFRFEDLSELLAANFETV